MKVSTQRFIDRYAGTSICRILSLVNRLFGRNAAAVETQNILVIILSEMGALVLAAPMFRRLRQKFPAAALHVLLFEKNREVLELLGIIPPENILSIRDNSMSIFTRDTARVLQRMRRIKFDTVIDCELFSRISSILSFLSGAAVRVGFHPHTQEGLYRGNYINRPVPYNPYHHISRQFLTLAGAVDSKTHPKAKHPVGNEKLAVPAVAFEPAEIEKAKTQLTSYAPGIQGKKIVLIYPGGGLLPIRAWPLPYYCRLTRSLLDRGYAVCVIGLAEDRAVAAKIISDAQDGSCADLTGYTKTVRDLMAIFHFASLLITNDGGPGHFAALTPIPTIIFFGPETPTLYGSMNANATNLYLSFSCSPCVTAYNHRNSPCDGDNQCLKTIEPDMVLEKALGILEGTSPNKRA